ncbi:hypothetical protein, partial [Mesorhizobium sp. M0768]|uniref:hypothetical protein n=1 Tax=Mesorhizobium sp. M0768 TaxID=2956996 RepID=UPI0033393929
MTELRGKLIFISGVGNHRELWRSDGTAAGTVEVPVTHASEIGVAKQTREVGFEEFGGNLYFRGCNSSDVVGFWKTDGTSAGTVEIVIRDAHVSGAWPWYFTKFGQKFFFSGFDEDRKSQLWESDGTPLGTIQVVPVRRASNASGLTPAFLTPLNGKLLFQGKRYFRCTLTRALSTDGLRIGNGIWSDQTAVALA